MTANENNRRYLAEAWIDEDKDEEFKKSFLENLLNQLEHHKADGSGFDADMLDGKHYCEISKEIDEKVKGFLNDFSIGKVHISNENGNEYTLGFDAITLYAPVDGYSSEEKTLPWDDSPRETSKTLLEVFRELYEKVVAKVDQDEYNEKIEEIETAIGPIQELTESISSSVNEDGTINATTINGIQIYILSESAYDRIPQSEKNDIKNVYIVKPDTEVDLSVYPDGIITNNTNVAEISRFYQFRVKEKRNQETGVIEKWLQYRYEGTSPEREDGETEEAWQIRDDATWNDMAKTSDFLDNSLIQNNIITYLSGGDYNLSPRAVKSSFDQIDSFNKLDTNSFPTQFLLRNFLSGVKYTPDSQEEDPIVHTLPNQGNSQYLDLDLLIDKIEGIIDTKVGAYWETVYPVGSIYISLENTSPEVLFGGEWEKIEDRFLFAANPNREEYKLGNSGGEEKVKLETSELPSHYHAHSHTHVAPGGIPYMVSPDDIKVNLDNYRKWPEKVSSGGIHIVYAPKGAKSGITSSNNTGAASSQITGNTGGGQVHENMPPYLSVNMWRRTA